MKADYTQMSQTQEITATCPNGATFTYTDAVVVPLVVGNAATLSSGHTIGDAVDAMTAQQIARAVMDALAKFTS